VCIDVEDFLVEDLLVSNSFSHAKSAYNSKREEEVFVQSESPSSNYFLPQIITK